MKNKKLIAIVTASLMVMSMTACGNEEAPVNSNVSSAEASVSAEKTSANTEAVTPEPTVEPTAEPHTHAYTDAVTLESTCMAEGVKTFTCECGDSYTEVIPATGHQFVSYVSNNDATYLADGTETATCVCGETDVRVAEGSKLNYTYADANKTMYAKSSVNVRSLPSTDGEKLGSLNLNDEVAVTGICNETGWYRFSLNGVEAYVSDSYLVNDRVVVQVAQAQPNTNTNTGTVANPNTNTSVSTGAATDVPTQSDSSTSTDSGSISRDDLIVLDEDFGIYVDSEGNHYDVDPRTGEATQVEVNTSGEMSDEANAFWDSLDPVDEEANKALEEIFAGRN